MRCKILQVVSEPGMSGVRVTGHVGYLEGVAAGVLLRIGLLRSTFAPDLKLAIESLDSACET